MHSLREMQAGFAAALFNPGASRDAPGIRADGISPAVRLGLLSHQRVRELPQGAGSRPIPRCEKLIGSGLLRRARARNTRGAIRRARAMSGAMVQQFRRIRLAASGRAPAALSRRRRAPGMVHRGKLQRSRTQPRLSVQRLTAVPAEHCEQLRFLLAPSCRLMSLALSDRSHLADLSAGSRGRRAGRSRCGWRRSAGPPPGLYRDDRSASPLAELAMLTALSSGYDFAEAFDYARSMRADIRPGRVPAAAISPIGVLADFTLPAERAHGAVNVMEALAPRELCVMFDLDTARIR